MRLCKPGTEVLYCLNSAQYGANKISQIKSRALAKEVRERNQVQGMSISINVLGLEILSWRARLQMVQGFTILLMTSEKLRFYSKQVSIQYSLAFRGFYVLSAFTSLKSFSAHSWQLRDGRELVGFFLAISNTLTTAEKGRAGQFQYHLLRRENLKLSYINNSEQFL